MIESQIEENYQKALINLHDGLLQEFVDEIIKQQINYYNFLAISWQAKQLFLKEKRNAKQTGN